MADDQKNPKEASNIFHSIMKASVTPPKKMEDEEEGKKEESKPQTKPKSKK